MAEFGRSPRETAADQLRQLVRRVAVEVFDGRVVEKPIHGFTVITDTALKDPLTGVRAALLLRRVIEGHLQHQAREARAAGRSWDEVGAALDLPDYEFDSRAEVTFAWLVEGREPEPETEALPTFRAPSTRWRCGTCDQPITDHGPYGAHPDDGESGHAEECDRHRANVAAWATRTGWEGE